MTVIRFRRGNKADLPASAPSGLPLWCEDTKELYVGTGTEIFPVGNNISFPLYSVNSGNQNSSGYADIINKVSNTEVSFKVGGSYPNMGVTFPNGHHYVISSIANISGLNSDGTYTFILEENNLTYLGNGTYSAIAVATLQQDLLLYQTPIMTANNLPGGYVASGSYNDPSYPVFQLFDRNNSTLGVFSQNGEQAGVYAQIQYATARVVNSYYFKVLYGSPTGWDIKGSNNGSTWTTLESVSSQTIISGDEIWGGFNNETSYLYYRLQITGANGTQLMSWRSLDFMYRNRIERLVLPSNPANNDYILNISTIPFVPQKYNGSNWIDRQFVKLGKVLKTGGELGTPQSYAFNGQFIGFTGFESDVGSEYIRMNTLDGRKLIKRAF